MIDPNDAPPDYEAKAPLAGKSVCAGCAFSDPPLACGLPSEAPACDKFNREDGESVIFVKKGHELDEVVAVMYVALSKFLDREPPQPPQ